MNPQPIAVSLVPYCGFTLLGRYNGLKYHLWRSGPDAVRTLCGGMRALEDTVMLRPADSEQDAQTWSLCVRCRNLIPQEYRG